MGVPFHSKLEVGLEAGASDRHSGAAADWRGHRGEAARGGRRVRDRLHNSPAVRRPGLVGDCHCGVVDPGAGVRMRVGERHVGVTCVSCQHESPGIRQVDLTGDGDEAGSALTISRQADRTAEAAVHTAAVPPVHVRVVGVLGASVCDRAGDARRGPNLHRRCVALIGGAVRVERQRGRHIVYPDAERIHRLLPVFIGRGQKDRVSAAGREGVVRNAVAGDGRRVVDPAHIYWEAAHVARVLLELPRVAHGRGDLPLGIERVERPEGVGEELHRAPLDGAFEHRKARGVVARNGSNDAWRACSPSGLHLGRVVVSVAADVVDGGAAPAGTAGKACRGVEWRARAGRHVVADELKAGGRIAHQPGDLLVTAPICIGDA